MIEITPSLSLAEDEIQFDFIRASGPGGQNVNKVATSVQLRFDVCSSPSLLPDVKERLTRLAGSRMTADGVLLIQARRYRTQDQNRLDSIQRLIVLIRKALVKPKVRKATRPSLTARAARISEKKRQGEIKRTRRNVLDDWE
ncbi:MAG: aminoacyl-tRNA hydrolase [Anaerolineales bacterium]|nr:aminoacyl-tRNA hydrolase [Anaerolineales bacterium]